MRRDLADQRDDFPFYLAVISYANSTSKVKTGEDEDDSCPQNLDHSPFLGNARFFARLKSSPFYDLTLSTGYRNRDRG